MAARLKIEEGKFVARRIVDPVVSTELRLIYKERRPLSKAANVVKNLIFELVNEDIAQSIAAGGDFLRH